MDGPRPPTSRGVPHLRNAPDPILYLFYHSSNEEYVESEEYTLPTKQHRTMSHSGEFSRIIWFLKCTIWLLWHTAFCFYVVLLILRKSHVFRMLVQILRSPSVIIPTGMTATQRTIPTGRTATRRTATRRTSPRLSDCESEEEFVPLDTSLDSDENITKYVKCHRARTTPGISSFVWRKWENEPRSFNFTAAPGVKVPDPGCWIKLCRGLREVPDRGTLRKDRSRDKSENTSSNVTCLMVWKYIFTISPALALANMIFSTPILFLLKIRCTASSNETRPLVWRPFDVVSDFPVDNDRFYAFASALHFADNQANRPADDQHQKFRPIVDVLNQQFRSFFVPNRVVSIDENLWAFKGCHQVYSLSQTKEHAGVWKSISSAWAMD